MIKNLNNACFSNRAAFKIFHSVFSRKIYCLNFSHWIHNLGTLFLIGTSLNKINLVSDQNLDRNFTSSFAFRYPLINFFERLPLWNIKKINNSSWAIYIFMHILMMSFFSRHIEIHNFILVGIIYVKSGFYMKLTALFIFNDTSQSLRNRIQKGCFSNSWVPYQCNLKSEMIIIVFRIPWNRALISKYILLRIGNALLPNHSTNWGDQSTTWHVRLKTLTNLLLLVLVLLNIIVLLSNILTPVSVWLHIYEFILKLIIIL